MMLYTSALYLTYIQISISLKKKQVVDQSSKVTGIKVKHIIYSQPNKYIALLRVALLIETSQLIVIK